MDADDKQFYLNFNGIFGTWKNGEFHEIDKIYADPNGNIWNSTILFNDIIVI